MTTFWKSPVPMRKKARPTSIRRGSRGVSSWGTSSDARTMGPATRCGKKERKTANLGRVVGCVAPR